MERERLDDQQAFIDLRRAARSSRRESPVMTGQTIATCPCRMGEPNR